MSQDVIAAKLDKLIDLNERMLTEMKQTRAQLAKVEAALARQGEESKPVAQSASQTSDPAMALAATLKARNAKYRR